MAQRVVETKGKRRGRPVLELLAALLTVACLIVVGFLGWRMYSQLSAQPAAGSTPTRAPLALWEAYGRARALAQAKAPDMQLVSASTQWQAAGEGELLAGASEWSFLFYSPSSSTVVDVGVGPDAAQLAKETRVWVAPTTMAEGGWQQGPSDALSVFLAYGGRAFLEQHPEALVDVHLSEHEDERRPVWAVVALDAGDRSLLSLLIDTENSVVLNQMSRTVGG